MLKRNLSIIIIFLWMIALSTCSYATELKTSLNIIQKASETKYLEKDQGFITKTIIDSNQDTGEVTIELKIANSKKETEKTANTEIFLVVDNSPSMDFITSTGKTRKDLILNSASQLVTSIFNSSNSVKIGLIDFHGHGLFSSGSISDATVRQGLTENKDSILSALTSQLNRKTESGTNIQAGVQRAQENFTNTADNKIIILLTDGIPNTDVSGNHGGSDVNDAKNMIVAENTKNALLKLKKQGIYTITMLTGMSETDGNTDQDGQEYEQVNTTEEKLLAAQNIFGTENNPTSDKYYLVSNLNINKIVTEDILKEVINKIQNPINTIKIVDYFPPQIAENFEFSYVGDASVGTRTEQINYKTNTIEWDIGTLKGDEVATLKYKLKIKDMKNETLLNQTIATNEKVILTYKDINLKEYTVTLSSSPKIQLSEIKEKPDAPITKPESKEDIPTKDTTTAKGILPQTGLSVMMKIISIVGIILVTIIIYQKYHHYKDIK